MHFLKNTRISTVSSGYTDEGCYENKIANIIINRDDEGCILVI
jgi:hypothetical protein